MEFPQRTNMIHALPGMGADRRMYPAPWDSLPHFAARDWVRPAGEKTLKDIAASMCAAKGIRNGDVLVGASLGGMVACEITKIRNIRALYLVGSAISKGEVNGWLAALHPLAQVAPLDWLQVSAGQLPTQLADMFSQADAGFVRTMCSAIFAWEGLGDTQTKVFRLHGKHDLVIPPPAHADLLLDGGHLITMSQAGPCVNFIRRSVLNFS